MLPWLLMEHTKKHKVAWMLHCLRKYIGPSGTWRHIVPQEPRTQLEKPMMQPLKKARLSQLQGSPKKDWLNLGQETKVSLNSWAHQSCHTKETLLPCSFPKLTLTFLSSPFQWYSLNATEGITLLPETIGREIKSPVPNVGYLPQSYSSRCQRNSQGIQDIVTVLGCPPAFNSKTLLLAYHILLSQDRYDSSFFPLVSFHGIRRCCLDCWDRKVANSFTQLWALLSYYCPWAKDWQKCCCDDQLLSGWILGLLHRRRQSLIMWH